MVTNQNPWSGVFFCLSDVKELMLTESAVKYADYLEYNLLVCATQADSDEPYYGVEVIPLPNAETFRKKIKTGYLSSLIGSHNVALAASWQCKII